jgi:hypothetical protein
MSELAEAQSPKVVPPTSDAAEKFKYPPHPVAEIFPLLDPTSQEFLSLVEDIKENGLKNQIILYEGKILDGRNRALALAISGREIKDHNFDPPPLKWSDLSYVFDSQEGHNGKEALQS